MITVTHNGERYEVDGSRFCSISRRAAMIFANPATKLPLEISEPVRGESFRALVGTIHSQNLSSIRNPLLVLEAALEWRCDMIVAQIERQILNSGKPDMVTSALLFSPVVGDILSLLERYVAEHIEDFLAIPRFASVRPHVLHRILSWYDVDLSRHPKLFDFLCDVLKAQGVVASLLFQCVDLISVPIEKVTELVLDPNFDPSFVAEQLEEVAEIFENDAVKENHEEQASSALGALTKEKSDLKRELAEVQVELEQEKEKLKLLEGSQSGLAKMLEFDVAGGDEQLRRIGRDKEVAEKKWQLAEASLKEAEQPWRAALAAYWQEKDRLEPPLREIGNVCERV